MASTATLPGGGKSVFKLPIGADVGNALQTAINSEFKAAGKNFTMNIVDSKAPGKANFFNAVINQATKAVSITAGTDVQAIFDLSAKGGDTLIGGSSTNLIYANATAKGGDSISVTGNSTVFGTAGADTLSVNSGTATAYLEGGNNAVTLIGNDTLTLVGTGIATVTGGSGKVSVAGGTGTLSFTHNKGGIDTVSVSNKTGGDTLTGALGSTGTDVFNITLGTSGKYVINSFSSTSDKIDLVGVSSKDIATALKNAHTVKSGSSIVTTITIGKDTIQVTGGAVNNKNFT